MQPISLRENHQVILRVMDMIAAREQKRQRIDSNSHVLDDMEDTLDAIEGGKHLGRTEGVSGTIELVTDDENYNDEDTEDICDADDHRVIEMMRQPDYQDEIDRAAVKIDKCSKFYCILFCFLAFLDQAFFSQSKQAS